MASERDKDGLTKGDRRAFIAFFVFQNLLLLAALAAIAWAAVRFAGMPKPLAIGILVVPWVLPAVLLPAAKAHYNRTQRRNADGTGGSNESSAAEPRSWVPEVSARKRWRAGSARIGVSSLVALVVAMFPMAALVFAVPDGAEQLWAASEIGCLVAYGLGVWLVLFHPRIDIGATELTVVNPIRRFKVPFDSIVEAKPLWNGLEIRADGQSIRAWALRRGISTATYARPEIFIATLSRAAGRDVRAKTFEA